MKKKPRLSLLATIVLATYTVTGCGAQNPEAEQNLTVSANTAWVEESPEEGTEEFTEKTEAADDAEYYVFSEEDLKAFYGEDYHPAETTSENALRTSPPN